MDFEILKSFIMPHSTVTVDAYTPPDHYNVYANAFDLSLLPTDGDALSQRTDNDQLNSEQTLHNSTEQTAAAIDADISLDDYIPTTVYQHFTVKTEHHSTSSSASFYSTNAQPDRSPTGSDQYFSVFPPSPAPSNDSTHTVVANTISTAASNATTTTIKQEYCSTLYPPSPPDSYGSLSPRCASDYVKGEHVGSPSSVDASEACLDIESLLGAVVPDFTQQQHDHQQDHQLLREFLQDTTFQRRHNLKPLALDALLMGGWDNGDDIGPVISLALEHARKDVQRTCEVLHISPDPQHWSIEHVQSWLLSTISQFGLSVGQDLRVLFPEDGAALSRLSDEDFVNRLSQNGRTLHAQLEVWKAACNDSIAGNTAATCYSVMDMMDTMEGGSDGDAGCNQGALSAMPWSPAEQSASVPDECSDDEDDEMSLPALAGISSVVAATDSTSAGLTDVAAGAGTTTVKAPGAKTGGRQGGAHIHLWQFLKELLADAQQHGTAIRWLDRAKGVFKIEDSVRVARLWGRRKNRPAMNYDKLSRSIRQYYKKGIMKKTERSQRLVYQFCHPYCL